MDHQQVSLGIAFVAGFFSFLSPCVLPLIPGYISFLSGISLDELKGGAAPKKVVMKAGLSSVFFVLGFSVVFVALGASASLIGQLLQRYIDVITCIAGVLIVVMGLYLTGILRMDWLNFEKKFRVKKFSPGFLGAFVVGLAFALGWTPCVGPILAGILALAAKETTVTSGMLFLFAYSMGVGIPFIITGFAVGLFMRVFEKYKRFIRWGEIAAGVFLVFIGVLIFFNNLDFLLKFIPKAS
jgi:cytochrome c-type biogenesis protein